MAQVNAGRVRFVSRGEYNNSTQYYLFDLVDYNGSSYFAKANTTGNVPTNTTYWQLVAEKGNTGNVGPTGPTGNGIASIVKTASAGLIDTYTITFTDGTTSTFNITNGADGDVTQEYVDEENERLKSVFNVLPKVSDSGESIELENTGDTMLYKMDLKGNTSQEVIQGEVGLEEEDTSIYVDDVNEDKENYITLKGNTYQDSTTGNQLIDFTNPTAVNSAVTYSFQNNILSASGTGTYISAIWNITSLYKANAGKTLKFSFKQLSNVTGSGTITQINVSYNDGTVTQYLSMLGRNGKLINRQIPNDVSNVQNVSFNIYPNNQSPAEAGSVTIEEPLLYFDNNTYEPYTNGASPNPDYPQEIEVVTGLNEVKVEGKNLFDKDNANILNAYISLGNSKITSSNGDNCIYIPIKSNTTYTITKILSNRFVIGCTDILPTTAIVCSPISTNQSSNTTYTITSGANSKYLVIYCYTISDTLTLQEILNSIQIEQGSTATTYEAYKGQTYEVNLGSIELCKIGTYQDRIYKNNGNWYLEKKIEKIVLNGSESWGQSSYTNDTIYSVYGTVSKNGNGQGISDLFIWNDNISSSTVTEYIQIGGATSRIGVFKTRLSANTIADFKNWLSNNNVTTYYVLVTPTTTQITDTTLISQLNALYNATIYSTTHINTETSNLLPYIDLKYNVVTASPSPDKASEVEVVKGNNTITISNEDGTKTQTFNLTLGNLELCKIGNYQDYFYKDNGNWYKYNAIGKVVLDGSEEWTNPDTYQEIRQYQTIKNDVLYIYDTITRILSNYYKGVGFGNSWAKDNTITIAYNKVIRVMTSKYTTVNDFKDWLSTHNTTCYYVLSTPTTTQITDQLLVSQLDELQKAMSYYDKTLITQVNDDKPFILDVVAIRDLQDIFNL